MANHFVVTGASSGIGRALADLLVSQGHQVMGISRRIPEGNFHFQHISLDITNEQAIDEFVMQLRTKDIQVIGLVNCAGTGIGGAIEETPIADVRQLVDVNLMGMIMMTQAFLPMLRETKGIVLNVGSVAGTLTIPFQTFYSMTKAAVLSFSEGLRLEVKPLGIRVTTLLPGDTKTGFTAARKKTLTTDSSYKERVKRSIERMEHDEQHGMSPLILAKRASRLLMMKNPPVAVTVGLQYHVFLLLKKWLPHRIVMAVLYQLYGK